MIGGNAIDAFRILEWTDLAAIARHKRPAGRAVINRISQVPVPSHANLTLPALLPSNHQLTTHSPPSLSPTTGPSSSKTMPKIERTRHTSKSPTEPIALPFPTRPPPSRIPTASTQLRRPRTQGRLRMQVLLEGRLINHQQRFHNQVGGRRARLQSPEPRQP